MDEHLQARFTKYVNRENPLGPADAYLIKDTEVAAHLFDPHNRSFNGLLRKDISVVIGRRGSGKTALLNSYLYKPYFSKGDITSVNNSSSDINDYKLVIPIMGHRLFEHMQTIVAVPGGAVRPIESIVERWSDLVVDYVLATILSHERNAGEDDKHIKVIEGYIASPDAKRKVEAYNLVWGHLAQIAAYRYRLFLRIFDDEGYRQVASIDLNHREGARRFWYFFRRSKPIAMVMVRMR